MVKSPGQAPPSHKRDEKEAEKNRDHPLRRQRSITDDLLEAATAREAQKELVIERIEDWKKTLNRLASSPDGQLLFTYMLRACNLFTPGAPKDTVQAVVDKQRQDFYLRFCRPYIDPSIRKEFE